MGTTPGAPAMPLARPPQDPEGCAKRRDMLCFFLSASSLLQISLLPLWLISLFAPSWTRCKTRQPHAWPSSAVLPTQILFLHRLLEQHNGAKAWRRLMSADCRRQNNLPVLCPFSAITIFCKNNPKQLFFPKITVLSCSLCCCKFPLPPHSVDHVPPC